MTYTEIKDQHSVSEKEGRLLHRLARNCTGVIVEIGSWKGYSTIWLGKGSQEDSSVEVYAIDPHTGSDIHREMYGKVWTFEKFMKNIKEAGVSDVVIPFVMTSEEAEKVWSKPVELLWIDGDHKTVEEDVDMWLPHLMDGGIIALHDTTTWIPDSPVLLAPLLIFFKTKSPFKVAVNRIYKSDVFTDIGLVGSITYARKVEHLTRRDSIRNRLALSLRYGFQLVLPFKTLTLVLGGKYFIRGSLCRK